MNELLKEFYEAFTYLKSKGWETKSIIDIETGPNIVPFIYLELEEVELNIFLNDTYYIQVLYKNKVKTTVVENQVRFSPEGNIKTPKEKIESLKSEMTEKDATLFQQVVLDMYYFFKPNSINFIME